MDMQAFLQQAAGQLGIGEDQAGKAVGGVLGLIREKADPADAEGLLDALPGAAALADQGSGGGLMGGLMGAASGLLGGKAGTALDAMAILKGSGLDAGQGASLLGLFLDFARKNAGDDLVGRIMEQIPQLKGLLGK